MPFAPICRLAACIAVLVPAVLSGACTPAPSVAQSWNGAGWYLQKPYLIAAAGSVYFGGPYTYDKCEEERAKQPPETATQMLCVRENRRPDTFGRS
ncbi:MAG: hypothetical protein FJX11_19545 [Alphaproteobacteria bacterium]|nr:hypothetical protein [Alphaproteobacteria bacterium]